jgi:hypothetical protein
MRHGDDRLVRPERRQHVVSSGALVATILPGNDARR